MTGSQFKVLINLLLGLSDSAGGRRYVLFVFAPEEAYKDVAVGDTVTCRGNYLGVTNEFSVVMKRGELL